MTQRQLEGAVADATGESLAMVRNRGFGLMTPVPPSPAPEGLVLAVDCPLCRRPVAYPGRGRDGLLHLAECLPCDLYFAIRPDDIRIGEPV
ncbi:MAG: hypothetical protein P4L85_27175 [Paludisphaera borealis]|uniref:hypothetical protein n=1 Tax=Paludisphaera borealis TaxID=1387353 RepID=UPI00284725A0|nr:hypothetical protein [Paludisphaera borealis]MDR3623065.1 hypothetical protein [Paludisphaera borealis]